MTKFEYVIYISKNSTKPYAGFASESCAVTMALILRDKFPDTTIVDTEDGQSILF